MTPRVLLILVILACDAQPSTTLRVLGADREPDWSKEECMPPTQRALFGVPSDRYWRCNVPRLDASFTVDWWRDRAIGGRRSWFMRDSASWVRFADSTAQALGAIATARLCTDRDVPEGMRLEPGELRLWIFTRERRWASVSATWTDRRQGFHPVRGGSIEIVSDTGSFDSCRAFLELENVSIN